MTLTRRNLLTTAITAAGAAALSVAAGGGTAAAATHPKLGPGSSGRAVLALQVRLNALGYWLGVPDGKFGPLTTQAVLALQSVAGLRRDGVVGPAAWAKIDGGVRPRARTRVGNAIELNKATQTLLVVSGGVVKAIYHISTGSGQRYYSRGAWHTATTPTGSYHVFRSVRGWDRGPLGSLYRPAYFSGGFAVHGALSVPPWPASHGCARVAVAAMDHLWASGSIRVGSPVRVY